MIDQCRLSVRGQHYDAVHGRRVFPAVHSADVQQPGHPMGGNAARMSGGDNGSDSGAVYAIRASVARDESVGAFVSRLSSFGLVVSFDLAHGIDH